MVDGNMALPASSEIETSIVGTDKPAPIGLFQKSDEDIIAQLRLWWKESAEADTDARAARKKERAALAGHQWDDDDRKRMADAKRPFLTLNLLQSMMAAVEGSERNNRQDIKLYGEGEKEDSPAYWLNLLVKWVMDQCGGEFGLSAQFRHGFQTGEGRIGIEVDYFDDPEGMIKLVYVPDTECYGDPLSTDPTAKDERYFHRVRMYSADEMEARWPGSTDKVKDHALSNEIGSETDGKGFRDIYLTPGNTASPKFYDAEKRMWAVLESWWTQIEPGVIVVNEATGLLEEKTPEEFAEMTSAREQEQVAYRDSLANGSMMAGLQQQHQNAQMAQAQAAMAGGIPPGTPLPPIAPPEAPPMPPPLDSTQRPVRRIYQAFSTYGTMLSKAALDLPNVKRIPYPAFRAFWDDEKKSWFGLLRGLMDPQKQHNVEQSAIVQLVQLMPKASWMAPKGAFHDKAMWQEKIATPGQMLEYNDRRGKPEQIPTPPIPRHMIDLAQSRPEAMRQQSGINIELTGVRQGGDAGVVMDQRAKAALTVLAPLFDNFRENKKEVGKLMLAYIQKYVTKGRKIRVLGPESVDIVEMTMDMSIGRYDVVVEETNNSVNDRMATLGVFQTTLPQLLKAGMPLPPSVVDVLPMPPKVRDEMKRMVAWTNLVAGHTPPPDWKIGDPLPPPPPPPGMPGMVPPGGEPSPNMPPHGMPPLPPGGPVAPPPVQ
jgi:hypothetical protein